MAEHSITVPLLRVFRRNCRGNLSLEMALIVAGSMTVAALGIWAMLARLDDFLFAETGSGTGNRFTESVP